MSVDEIRAINSGTIDEYIKDHAPSYRFDQFPKRKSNMVIACMDPRSNPNEFWGITESDPKMAVLRNAGGRVTEDVLRSIRVIGGIFGYGDSTVGAVAVVHHKDCGMTHFRNEKIGELLVEHAQLEGKTAEEAKKLDYGEITDVEGSVWEDMKKLKQDPYLPKDLGVIGYVWDSLNNNMKEVGVL